MAAADKQLGHIKPVFVILCWMYFPNESIFNLFSNLIDFINTTNKTI